MNNKAGLGMLHAPVIHALGRLKYRIGSTWTESTGALYPKKKQTIEQNQKHFHIPTFQLSNRKEGTANYTLLVTDAISVEGIKSCPSLC